MPGRYDWLRQVVPNARYVDRAIIQSVLRFNAFKSDHLSHSKVRHKVASDKGWIAAMALIIFGIFIQLLALAESAKMDLPIKMHRSWYTNRWMWILFGVGMIYYGMRLFSKSASAQHRINERNHVFRSVVLYTRDGCHLCDDALKLLRKHDTTYPQLEIVDIDDSPDLAEQFNTCVPVVEIDGKVRFRGRVNEVLLNRLIEATRTQRRGSA